MHVCYLINQLAPGGAPTLLLDIISNTDTTEVSYTVCFIEGDDTLVADLERAGAEVVNFGASFKFDPVALRRMVQFFRQRKFDVLHAHLPYSQTLGRLCSLWSSVDSVVSTQHNVSANYHTVTRLLERITRPIDDATIAVSEGVERAFREDAHRYDGTTDNGWCTIYNGIDVSAFEGAVNAATPVQNTAHDPADLVYLNVARYVPAKSQETLIDAMATVVESVPNSHLYVVGWGEQESMLREQVTDSGLDDHVTVTGRVPTVHEYYKLADVFVSSSTFEGLPITHLEAMAADLPLVATSIPGVEEVVLDGETGLLVPPEDQASLADAMVELADEERRDEFATAGFRRVSERFSIEQTVESHLRLYRTLLGSSTTPT